ncbi:hypothetical protein [Flavobacterium pedocola]
MKTIRLFLLTVLGIVSLTSCKSDDDFYNAVYLDVADLITIDTPPSYTTGDNLEFHTDFSRYLPEANQANLLDIYRTSGAESFRFAYRLEKKDANNNWNNVLGANDEYSVAEAVYQSGTMTYKCDVAVPLTTTGQYRLSFGESYTGAATTELISRNPSDKTLVLISTNANALDAFGYYQFTVN